MHEPLPQKTVRDLGALLGYMASIAWRETKTFIRQIAPFVRPPDNMEIRTRDGAQYTGVVVVEENDVTAGAVVRVGHDAPRHRTSPYEHPLSTMERDRAATNDRGSALGHWAADPRDEEDDPWRR